MNTNTGLIEYVYIRFSDRAYRIDAMLIAQHRARYFADNLDSASEADQERTYVEELNYALVHFDVLARWAVNNMSWDYVESEAVRLTVPPRPPNLDYEWSTGQARLTPTAPPAE